MKKQIHISKILLLSIVVMLMISTLMCLLPMSVLAEGEESIVIVGNSVYRSSAESATLRFISDKTGVAYYQITESNIAPSTLDLATWTNAGEVTVNTTKTLTLTTTTGAKYVHIVVKNNDTFSNVLTVAMPYDYFYSEDFEAYPLDTYVAQSGSPMSPIKQVYNGSGNQNQKVSSASDNKFFSLTSSSNASVQSIELPSNYREGAKTLVLKGKVYPISEGASYHESVLFGIGDRKNGVLFINGKICYANKADIANITYSFNTWYEIELNVNLLTDKYDIKVDGTTIASDVAYNDTDKRVIMFAGHGTTAYFDDFAFYTSNDNLTQSIENKTATVSDTVYNGNEQKQPVTIDGLVNGTDFDVEYSTDCTNAGVVTVTITGKGNYFGTFTVTYNINQAERTAPVAPEVQSAGKNSITLKVVDGCEYSINGTTWQDSNIFDGLTIATNYTFYQRYKETTNYKSSATSSAEISTHTHNWATEWSKDGTHHWYECSDCEDKDSYIEHTFDQTNIQDATTLVTVATCKDNAVYKYTCVCGEIGTVTYEKTDSKDASNHSSAELTYTSNADGTHTKKNKCCGLAIETVNCSGGTPTCTTKAVCEYCDGEYGNNLPHTFDKINIQDATTLVSVGTCKGNAVYKYTCVCGAIGTATYEKTDSKNLDNHIVATFKYTNNGNGTHTKANECCGAIVNATEAHIYDANNTCVCGVVFIDEAPTNQGLSGGAIAGIVVGSIVIIGIAVFSIFWFAIKKKK